jgi:hypothetical protein
MVVCDTGIIPTSVAFSKPILQSDKPWSEARQSLRLQLSPLWLILALLVQDAAGCLVLHGD